MNTKDNLAYHKALMAKVLTALIPKKVLNAFSTCSKKRLRFLILIGAVFISGASQGMLLPLLSILLEQMNVSPQWNGLNASALYIGILIAAPFIEKPLNKYGYRPVLITGLSIVCLSLFLFPLHQGYWYWFVLRLLIGIGDNMLHIAAQVWITLDSTASNKGRNIAIYGLAFGCGFSVGPFFVNLLTFSLFLPFIIAGAGCLLFLFALRTIKNAYPDSYASETPTSISRYKKVLTLSWVAMLATFGYGFLESSLHGNFPVFALRHGFTLSEISFILPAFVIGSLVTQVPIASLSDRIGRKKTLLLTTFFGTLFFIGACFFASSFYGLLVMFLLAGMAVGSLYSLGMTYMSDLLPVTLIPLGNLLAGVGFSIGSVIGPYLGGIAINWFPNISFLAVLAGILAFLFIMNVATYRRKIDYVTYDSA